MTTPAPTTPTRPLDHQLVSRFKVEVDTNVTGTGAAAWVQLRGIRSLKPSLTPTMQDVGDFDSGPWGDQAKTMLAWGLDMTVKRGTTGTTTRVPDPGQEVVRKAAEGFGPSSVVHVRWYDRNGGVEAYEGYAEATWDPAGGDKTAVDEVSCNLTGKGERLVITNPATAAA